MINKKVFALSLVAASVIAAGCSSDDDDDETASSIVDLTSDSVVTDGNSPDINGDGFYTDSEDLNDDGIINGLDFEAADTDGDGLLSDEERAAVPGEVDPGDGGEDPDTAVVYPAYDSDGNSVADVIATDERLAGLSAIVPPALLDQLDYTQAKRDSLDTDSTDDSDVVEDVTDDVEDAIDGSDDDTTELPEVVDYTVFAPGNDALAALDTAGVSGEELSNILLGHVVQGESLPSVAIGDTFTAANGTTISITDNGTGGPVINDTINFVTDGTTEAENGYVHIIDMVILPPEDVTPPTDGGETPPTGSSNLGSGVDAIEANGNSEFVQIFTASGQGTVLNDQVWTIFVPTNDALDDGITQSLAADSEQANEVVRDHIVTDGAFEAGDFPATLTSNGGVTLNFSGGEDDLMVNGFSATRIESDSSSAIYQIDGVLQ